MNDDSSDALQELIDEYNNFIKTIDKEALEEKGRAYGGVVRSKKGNYVERLAESLVKLAWNSLKQDPNRLLLDKEAVKIPIKQEYLERIKNPEVRSYIEEHIADYYYLLRTDVQVYIDKQFIIAIECKAYTENAMLKRILVDFTLFKQLYPNLNFVLFQLESQLGGDYSSPNSIKSGSPSTHTLLSYFDVDLHIVTLLEGERIVDKPIHKVGYFKELKKEKLIESMELFKKLLM